jgi:squalene cyclase
MDPAMKGCGTATASQTAWALMGLLAADRSEDREAIEKGCLYLIDHQVDGTWPEKEYTGTGFPGYGVGQTIKLSDPLLSQRLKQGPELSRAFMLRYNLYRHYFPLTVLARALRADNPVAETVKGSLKARAPALSEKLGQGPELSRAFMVRWDSYRQYFPLAALARASREART